MRENIFFQLPYSNLLQLSCDLVATATQNNPVCQQVFTAALPRLLEVVDDSSVAEGARVKALYAISCESPTNSYSHCSRGTSLLQTLLHGTGIRPV